MCTKREQLAVRLEPDLAVKYRVALALRREKAQEMLLRAIQRYVQDTDELQRAGRLP